MKRITLAAIILITASASLAQERRSTEAATCAANQQLVEARGAVELQTSRTTYDRFVRDASFCSGGEYPDAAWVASRDQSACFIGYRCKMGPASDD